MTGGNSGAGEVLSIDRELQHAAAIAVGAFIAGDGDGAAAGEGDHIGLGGLAELALLLTAGTAARAHRPGFRRIDTGEPETHSVKPAAIAIGPGDLMDGFGRGRGPNGDGFAPLQDEKTEQGYGKRRVNFQDPVPIRFRHAAASPLLSGSEPGQRISGRAGRYWQ